MESTNINLACECGSLINVFMKLINVIICYISRCKCGQNEHTFIWFLLLDIINESNNHSGYKDVDVRVDTFENL